MGTKFILGQEDGTVAGGDPRGANAVDLQTSRGASNQVAVRDYTVVLGGQSNTSDGDDGRWGVVVGGLNNRQRTAYGVVVGGQSNQTGDGNAANSHIFIGGGSSNYSNGSYSVITGGRSNTTGNSYSVVSGGQSNTASTNTHATVVGGQQNVASGPRATVGGEASTSSGQVSTAFGYQAVANGYGAVYLGFQGTSSGSYSFSGGVGHTASARSTVCLGESNTASFQSAIALGTQSKAYLYGQKSIANGIFTAVGDAQQSQTTLRREAALTTGGTTVLSLDGGGGPSNTLIPDGNNRMWNVTIKYVAVVTTITGTATGVTVGDTKSQNIEIGFKKVGGVSSLVGGGSFSIPQEDASMSSASLIPTAGASQQLALTFTAPTFAGGGSVTCRVVAKVELVEVAY